MTPKENKMTKFRIGDRVQRLIDYDNPDLGYKYGTIIKIYSRCKKVYGDGIELGPYPELYDVNWDTPYRANTTAQKAFLPYGLDKIKGDK